MTLFLQNRELLSRFRAGEKKALGVVYRHYAPLLAAFLSKGFVFKSGDRALRFEGYKSAFDLDNALAETFVRAFREPARLSYDGLHPYKSYLFTIGRNITLDELRGREMVMSTPAGVEELIEQSPDDDERPSAEDALLARELAGLCSSFVERLGERDRSFFVARFEQTKTQVDAGKVAGLSHMQARSLEKKLRERLFKFLQARGYLEGRAEVST